MVNLETTVYRQNNDKKKKKKMKNFPSSPIKEYLTQLFS